MSMSAATVAVSRGVESRARRRARVRIPEHARRGDEHVATRARGVSLQTLDRALQRVDVILRALGDHRGEHIARRLRHAPRAGRSASRHRRAARQYVRRA